MKSKKLSDINNSVNNYICYSLTLLRKHPPRNQKFAEETVQRYSTTDLRTHFLEGRTTFEGLLRCIALCLTVVHERGKRRNNRRKADTFINLVYDQSRMQAGQ